MTIFFRLITFFLNAHVYARTYVPPWKSVCMSGNALEEVQRVHEPTDLWDITFCTHRLGRIKFQKIFLCSDAELIYM